MRLERSTVQLIRLPFSIFLMPVYWFALSQAVPRDWGRALLIFLILHFLIYPASNGYNSYMDRDSGPIGGVRQPLQPTRQLYVLTLAMDLLGLLLGLLISWYFTIGLLLYVLASRAYSYRGIRIKKHPFAGWLTVVCCQGALVFFLVFEGSHPSAAGFINPRGVTEAMIVSSLLLGGFYPLTQVYQHEADSRDGVRTLSMVLGYRGSFVFTGCVYVVAFLLLAHYFLSTLQTTEFYVLATCMLPVVVYFLIWAVRVWRDDSQANHVNSTRMNLLGSICLNLGFIGVLITGGF